MVGGREGDSCEVGYGAMRGGASMKDKERNIRLSNNSLSFRKAYPLPPACSLSGECVSTGKSAGKEFGPISISPPLVVAASYCVVWGTYIS